MDADRFDALTRSIDVESRRAALRALGVLGVAGVVAHFGVPGTDAKKHHHHHHHHHRRRRRRRAPAVDPCPNQKRCAGVCISKTDCCTSAECTTAGALCCDGQCAADVGGSCSTNADCCSDYCRPTDAPTIKTCTAACSGKTCSQASDCC